MNGIFAIFQPVWTELVMTAGLALAGYVTTQIRSYNVKAQEQLGVKIDADRLLVLENALKNAVLELATRVTHITPNEVYAYLKQMSPDTIREIGLTEATTEKVAKRMAAAIARYKPVAPVVPVTQHVRLGGVTNPTAIVPPTITP